MTLLSYHPLVPYAGLIWANDMVAAHENFLIFSLIKRSNLNADKCVVLPINRKRRACVPTLKIGEYEMKLVKEKSSKTNISRSL